MEKLCIYGPGPISIMAADRLKEWYGKHDVALFNKRE